MNLQKIEPLLMDYALGATTPEVAALVEALQETNAEVRGQVSQWQGIVDVARQAMGDEKSVAIPVFPRSRLQAAQHTARRRRSAFWAAALAACLMLGYLAGIRGRDQKAAETNSNNVPVAAVEDFWSTARLRAVAERGASRPARATANSFNSFSVLRRQFGG